MRHAGSNRPFRRRACRHKEFSQNLCGGKGGKVIYVKNKEIEAELERIYKERKSWNGAKGPFTNEAINYRKLIFMKQYTLYGIQDARKEKEKKKEAFNLEIYKVIDEYLKGK